MKKQDPKQMKQFMTWFDEQDPDNRGYWEMYDSLEDAVSSKGDGCEVFVMEPKFLGKFKRKVELVKLPKSKTKK